MAASLASRARSDAGGVFREAGKDGPAYVAFSRSPRFGWTTSLAASATAIDATATRPLWTVLGVGLGMVLVGASSPSVSAATLTLVSALLTEAARLGRGESPRLVRSFSRDRRVSGSLSLREPRGRVGDEFRIMPATGGAAEFWRRALPPANSTV